MIYYIEGTREGQWLHIDKLLETFEGKSVQLDKLKKTIRDMK